MTMPRVLSPVVRAAIRVRVGAEIGDTTTCKQCNTRFVVVDDQPVEIDFEDELEWDDDWDDDDDDD